MNPMYEPTPTPWTYSGWGNAKYDVFRDGPTPEERTKVGEVAHDADARLICRAVNCHAELLAALIGLADTVDAVDPGVYRLQLTEARRAIAKASN